MILSTYRNVKVLCKRPALKKINVFERERVRAHERTGVGGRCKGEGEGKADSPLSRQPMQGLIPGP